MLHCGNVENCEDTSAGMVERGKINWKGRTYCVARAPNDVSYKINTHIPDITPLSKGCSRMTTMDAKSSKSRRFYYSMSLASCSVPVLQRILDLLPPPSKSASEYGPHPRPNLPANMDTTPPPPIKLSFWAAFVLYLVIIIFLGGWNPRRIIFPPDKWVAWLAKLFCQSNKSRKTSPLPRFLGKDPSEWWEWSPATLLSTL